MTWLGHRSRVGSRAVILAGMVAAGQLAGVFWPVARPAILVVSLLVLDLAGAVYSARAARVTSFTTAWRLAAAGRACSFVATTLLLVGVATGHPVWWGLGLTVRSAMFLCLGAAVIAGPALTMRGHRLAAHLAELVTLFGGGFMLLWYFVLSQMFAWPEQHDRVAYGLFAIGDLLLAVGIVGVALSGALVRLASPLTVYVAGLALFTAADVVWSALRQNGVEPGASPAASALVVTASLLLTLAAMMVVGGRVTPAAERRFTLPDWSLYVPQILFATVCGLLLCVVVRGNGVQRWGGLLVGLIVMTAGVVARQYVAVQALRGQVVRDPLTGLPNRACFDAAVERALRREEDCALLFLDVSGLKLINDAYGHGAGDLVLTEVGGRLSAEVRGLDVCARFTGGEFAVLLTGPRPVTGQDVAAAARRILDAVVKHQVQLDGDAVPVRATMGGAMREAGDSPRELLRRADIALHHAKAGGHGYLLHHPTMVDRRREDAALGDDLRQAVQNSQFEVVYQPLVELGDERPIGAEALLRWRHPVHGAVSPVRFIPVAERSGTIVDIGLWVLEQACSQARRWQDPSGTGTIRYISVNLSPRQLQEPTLVADVLAVLERTGLEPRHLVLEVTESAIVEEDGGMEMLRALREQGIRIAIDDFGTGYSSLHYLTRMPVDILKIDRSFVAELDGSAEGSAIAEAVVRLSQALHLTTVAEGIETPDQAAELRRLGCELGQGYLFAAPLSATDCAVRMGAITGVAGNAGP